MFMLEQFLPENPLTRLINELLVRETKTVGSICMVSVLGRYTTRVKKVGLACSIPTGPNIFYREGSKYHTMFGYCFVNIHPFSLGDDKLCFPVIGNFEISITFVV